MAREDEELSPTFELSKYGWKARGLRWVHKNLNLSIFEWPTRDALRLTREALDGRMDTAHRMLRGEE